VNLFMTKAVDKGKEVAQSVKEKVHEMDIGTKVKSAGSSTLEKLKEAREIVKEKGTEVINSSTVQNVKTKVNDGYNYLYGKIFGKNEGNVGEPKENEPLFKAEEVKEINEPKPEPSGDININANIHK